MHQRMSGHMHWVSSLTSKKTFLRAYYGRLKLIDTNFISLRIRPSV